MTRWIIVWVCGLVWASPAAAVTDEDISAAVERMRAWLYEQQDQVSGSWDDTTWSEYKTTPTHTTAETALITYALLSSGESYQDPRIAKAINFLKANRVNSTYLASLRAHVWAALPDEYAPLLEQEAEYLRRAVNGGKFYYQADHPTWSNSLTQYGTLGLWEYSKRGGEVDEDVWLSLQKHMLDDQNDNGGWGYNDNKRSNGGGESTASMTAAGVTILQIITQQLDKKQRKPQAETQAAIDRGMAWLDQHHEPAKNVGNKDRFLFYTLYGVERLALANGVSQINGQDWFEAGARFILEREKERGYVTRTATINDSTRVSTAFALSFLSRGRVPLWAGKLSVPEFEWNNRPNDLYFLTRYLSDQREAELNWQVVSIDSDPELWLRCPVLYLSSSKAVKFTDAQRDNLKRYLDLGGMLVVNPEVKSRGFIKSIRALARQMYPDYAFENVDAEHPFAGLIVDLTVGGKRVKTKVQTLSNGVRDLIVMPAEDWGYDFQAKTPGRGDSWSFLTNLYATVSDRGQLNNRLVAPLPVRDPDQKAVGQVTVARLPHDGNWDAEPAALEVASSDVFNRSGITMRVQTPSWEDLEAAIAKHMANHTESEAEPDQENTTAATLPGLIHLAGTDTAALTAEQLQILRRYVDADGTVLVETVGGFGAFADDLGRQMTEAWNASRRWMDGSDPILTGEGLVGGTDVSKVRYRSYAELQGGVGDQPALEAIDIGGRPAVILSSRDLSLGLLGSRYYRVNGYDVDSARALVGNLVLSVAPPPAAPIVPVAD